jgi:ABC-type transporter Mla subunit MlaD
MMGTIISLAVILILMVVFLWAMNNPTSVFSLITYSINLLFDSISKLMRG